MSGATGAVVYTATNVAGASAAGAVFGAVATAGGVVMAGAVVYMAARQMNRDYAAAFADYQTRGERERAAWDERSGVYLAAQQAARSMALELSPDAACDPNAAFVLGALSRLRGRLGAPGDPDAPAGAAELSSRVSELAARVAAGNESDALADYEKLAAEVSRALGKRVAGDQNAAALHALLNDEFAALEADARASVLGESKHQKTLAAIVARIQEARALGEREPKMALQALQLLRNRARGEIRRAALAAKTQKQHAARVRELVGLISANAQAVTRQTVLAQPRAQAEAMLKRLSAIVAATPVELDELEALSASACALFSATEAALEDKALSQHLEDQVAQVLTGLGYRVSSAHGAQGAESKMVAVLDGHVGVQLNIGAGGHLQGEMVAFSPADADVEIAAQERVCDLMDAVFDGLRRRNLVVREKKRKNFKAGQDRLKVVELEGAAQGQSVGVAAPLAMRVGE